MRNNISVWKKLLSLFMGVLIAFASSYILIKNVTDVKADNTGFTQNDFLKCDGTSIKNNYGKGNYVYLRGTNIGNLFVQESWMSSTSATDQKTILENLTNRFGQDKALELLDYYESNYFTTDDIENCKNLGMSVIRVPFTYMNLYKKSGDDWVLRSDAFTRLDWIVNECSKRGIYVILDLHGAFGSQNGQDHSGEVISNASDVTFFSNETLMSKTLEMWKVIAQHYVGNPAIAGYDTLNEPGEKAGTTTTRHWNFYDRMYKTIRSVDPDHIVIMESCWGTSNLPNPSDYGWTNVMYEYHHYPWDYVADTDENYTGQKNAIDNLVDSVNNANYGVPTYIGEFNCFDGNKSWQYVLEKMNKAGWNYSNWAYKSRGMGSWGIYHEKGNKKVDPSSTSEADIKTIWGSDSIGTNINDIGVAYNNLKTKLPGTVVFADKALSDNDYFAIKANINSKYVCADNYGESNLSADRDSYGEWEQFRVIYNEDGTVSFQSRVNNKYLCTVFDDTDSENPIIARSNTIGTWEKFYVEKNSDNTYSLRTYVNDLYVQADVNDSISGILHACGESVGTWEKFSFTATNSDAIPLAYGENIKQEETTTITPETTTKAPETEAIIQETKDNSDKEMVITSIPGTVKVDSYSDKTDSISINTENGVTYAGNLNDSSYLDYYINVAKPGNYRINLKLAAGNEQWNAKNMTIKLNNIEVASILVTGSTGWTTFIDHIADINITAAGTYKLTIASVGGACNVSDFSIEPKDEDTTTSSNNIVTTKKTETSDVTTQASDINVPSTPVGLTYAGNDSLPYYFAWEFSSEVSYYNFYVNGEMIGTSKIASFNAEEYFKNAPDGYYTIELSAVNAGGESKKATIEFIKGTPNETTEENTVLESTTKGNNTVLESTTKGNNTVLESTAKENNTVAESTTSDTQQEIIIKESSSVQIEGYQISWTKGGSRVIGSVEPVIDGKKVSKWGFVYALISTEDATFPVENKDVYVGSENTYVTAYESTSAGNLKTQMGKSDTANYFVRTMLFANGNAKEFNAKYKVRAYALLEDGSYLYSSLCSYSVYNIAHNLYQLKSMNTYDGHCYLYNNILSVANPEYKEVDYN